MIKENSFSKVVYALTLILFCSCGGGGAGEEPLPEPQPANNLPAKVVATLPANGEPCADYTEVPADESKVSIVFNWNSAQYTDSYELVVSGDNTEVFKNSFTGLEAQVELERGKTYTWTVNSINEFGRTTGNTYSFTTPGAPFGNYAPYAAEVSIEFDAGAMEALVSWIGNDEDGDALTFDVKVWENENLLLEEVDYAEEFLESFTYLEEISYSVEVISKDPFGNYSVSTIYVEAP